MCERPEIDGFHSRFFEDCFNIQGVPSTIGFTSFIKNGPIKSNSALVDIIIALGGIPYVKTNVPQTIMVLLTLPLKLEGQRTLTLRFQGSRLTQLCIRENSQSTSLQSWGRGLLRRRRGIDRLARIAFGRRNGERGRSGQNKVTT